MLWAAVVATIALGAALPWGQWFGSRTGTEVVVYAAQDQVYAEPILREFTKQTGIKVRSVYDSEAVKTVGLANRLLAEARQPQCDLFWGNEEMRTRQLAELGIFQEPDGWAAFGYRTRRIVVNTAKAPRLNSVAPLRLSELTNQVWRGKVALAYPLFGTTATHFHALRQKWGDAAWDNWCRALRANRPLMVDGNSSVVKLVGRGEAWIGLTDSDDVLEGKAQGMTIVALPITDETLFIPNTVALVQGGPNPRGAARLFQYLRSRPVVDELVRKGALEGVQPTSPARLEPDWQKLLLSLEDTSERLKKIFLR
jgi:iron(III) transport system substrate-binding protein